MTKFKNVTKCNSCDENKARFTMEDETKMYFIDIDLNSRTVLNCSFKVGTYQQAMMLVQAIEFIEKSH